jgi:hypothetical protein
MSFKEQDDTLEQYDDKEAIIQSNSILVNKKILEFLSKYQHQDAIEDCHPIYIQLTGYDGYLYSIQYYNGVYIASQVCENILFIPQTQQEFQSFLFEGHVLEMLCNLKRHYVNIVKVVRHRNDNSNNNGWITAK